MFCYLMFCKSAYFNLPVYLLHALFASKICNDNCGRNIRYYSPTPTGYYCFLYETYDATDTKLRFFFIISCFNPGCQLFVVFNQILAKWLRELELLKTKSWVWLCLVAPSRVVTYCRELPALFVGTRNQIEVNFKN